jgi:tRNA(Ile)-lysidine synthase
MADAPIAAAEFHALLAPLVPTGAVAVAVSGGPDSLALTLLAFRWCSANGRRLHALTVDHGLRAESAAEAMKVGAWLAEISVPHTILRWEGAKPAHGIHAAARAARYRLLTEWCRAYAYSDLLLAHHRDDQAETMLMRLARASGPDGLAAMAAVVERDGVRLLRPLLTVPKSRLIASVRKRGQAWIDDPSNANPRFGRTRARAALASWSAAAAPLAAQAQSFGALRRAREDAAAALLLAAEQDSYGACRWTIAALREAEPAAARRALARALTWVGGRDYPPASAALDRMLAWLAGAPRGSRTLHGCVVTARGDGIAACRERRDLPRAHVCVGQTIAWDGRFAVCLERGHAGVPYEVAALAASDWPAVRRRLAEPVPRDVALTLPALYRAGRLLAAPQLGVAAGAETLRVSPWPGRTLAFRPFAVVSSPG